MADTLIMMHREFVLLLFSVLTSSFVFSPGFFASFEFGGVNIERKGGRKD